MARPKSNDKRTALLGAAIKVIAEQGLSAPTSKIAKVAGVSEGLLFTYFETKDTLLNELYTELKAEQLVSMLTNYPAHSDLKVRMRHIWDNYVGLGISHNDNYKVITQLSVSDLIWEETKLVSIRGYETIHAMVEETFSANTLNYQSYEFGTVLLLSLMNMTIELIVKHPAQQEPLWEAGFRAFWNALASANP